MPGTGPAASVVRVSSAPVAAPKVAALAAAPVPAALRSGRGCCELGLPLLLVCVGETRSEKRNRKRKRTGQREQQQQPQQEQQQEQEQRQ